MAGRWHPAPAREQPGRSARLLGSSPTGHDTAVPATAQPIDDEAVAGGDPASPAGGQVPGRSAATA